MTHGDRIAANWPAPKNVCGGTTLRTAPDENLGLPDDPCWLHQVHGNVAIDVGRYTTPPKADASVGRQQGDVCAVQTADCLPVLLCAVDGATIAAAHAGWRGLAAGILENTVALMDVDPGELMAWFGPAISQPCFEVGGEVRDAFVQFDTAAEACFVANRRGRWQADLYALARQRLATAGVSRIYGGDCCTYTDAARFFSYRRDPGCGRMVSYIARG